MPRLPKYDVSVGKKFGDLTVMAPAVTTKKGRKVLCLCKCGTQTDVFAHEIATGKTRSCGCFVKMGGARRTHGKSGTHTYKCWAHLMQRCTNSKAKDYDRYGGRGIHVCSQWLEFERFLKDMGEAAKGRSIERIDNDGNYEKNNCRWATDAEQRLNKRNTVLVNYKGKTLPLKVVAEQAGVSYNYVYYRYKTLGQTIEEVLEL